MKFQKLTIYVAVPDDDLGAANGAAEFACDSVSEEAAASGSWWFLGGYGPEEVTGDDVALCAAQLAEVTQ